ncbi:EcoAI/FtnUII family type I restriction enzme subunit R [Deinococcus cellulosilyticus]|uniref:Type I restriction enzyme EcoAI R protein n=1 Tax=Deinococcus cellulosilyticus (strain DSM 18568 / NBRC 106333 / KACC 11606 / 5516J-15) TaxID=1223518 RepID=A0A511N724_DEIC1|nr:DEAD/DEAH box helicase family protein [Deinococcus cellulosilyticus]GEM48645.1 type I restriction enzyme EcoAI R protein [Deinococcus cellulosilyticus NBRC 106333 = KACC 11606]
MIDKKNLSEQDICNKFITPALQKAGWDLQEQIFAEYQITKGRVTVRGQLHARGSAKRADYVLFYKPGIPIAVIEAKDNTHTVGHGMQQAVGYAEALEVPFVFSSNGDGFLFRNTLASAAQMETELSLDEFPRPEQLWTWWNDERGLTATQNNLVTEDYYRDGSGKVPRYYQMLAINKTTEAIARGQNRILLVMATGTGKTMTAFQIIWRLWRAKAKKRILFLADRNILIDQTMTNDFKPFGSAMTKISKRQTDKSYEIYLSLYQAITGEDESKDIYKQFSRDFFDLIVVDECHRGSAAEDSNWREILEYFSSATQIGLTATPKETKEVSNIDYFGEPIYTYSLKQGIDDGFLAPYRVVRFDFDKDLTGWRPEAGMRDKYGNLIEERDYNQKDYDKTLVLEPRTQLVAKKITEYLRATNPYDKTIVFCEDIEHAERMRQALVNENADLVREDPRYIMRITGDSKEGKAELDNFIFPESKYPVIAVTSKLMTTGVDAQTCKVIVLDQRIQSMTEFKQIIGRGTRINEDHNKFYFTILDFKRATALFADPAFDGKPVQVYEPGVGDPPNPPEPEGDISKPEPEGDPKAVRKYVVRNVTIEVAAERVMYYDANNQPITESLKDYTLKTLNREFASLDDFLRRWNAADRKKTIIEELEGEGVFFEALNAELHLNLDPFDLICHLAWDQPPLTRQERAAKVKKRDPFTKYGAKARRVLEALLEKYADQGITTIEDVKVLQLDPFRDLGTPLEIVKAFGDKEAYEKALRELEDQLYKYTDSA